MAGWGLGASAQLCPAEWVQYTFGGYLYDIQSDHNTRGLSETAFKNDLLSAAHANLAKKVQLQVKEFATLDKESVDGRSHIAYSSSTSFSTDVDLKLVGSHTLYDAATGQGFAIAFIDRDAACTYYKNEVAQVLSRVDNALSTANNYVASGFKSRAAEELSAVLPEFDKIESPLVWLNFFGLQQWELSEIMSRCNSRQQAVKQMLADLKHGTYICLRCTADLFGRPYLTLQNEIKGAVSADGCSFTDDPQEADWVIDVSVTVRESNIAVFGGMTSYFAYADAVIVVDKQATGQRIYEDEVSVKGAHTRNYTEAARVAYRDLGKRLSETVNRTLKQ